jgi:hypothetical protein
MSACARMQLQVGVELEQSNEFEFESSIVCYASLDLTYRK